MKCHFHSKSTEAGENFKEAEITEENSTEAQSNIVESEESSRQSTKTNSEAGGGSSKKSVGLTMSFDAGWQKKDLVDHMTVIQDIAQALDIEQKKS